jgi:2-methylcitrate dehydratase
MNAGIKVSAGTDPTRAASYDPWVSLAWLVTGKTVAGFRLYPRRNCLDRETALRMRTESVTWFSNEVGKKGRIQVGQFADLMVPFIGHLSLDLYAEIGLIVLACEHSGRSGKEFLTALAVAYQVQSILTASAPFMERGFDLTSALPYSIGAGVAKALGLDEEKTTAAVEICGQTGFQLLVARTTPISQWKGLTSSQVAFGCVNAVFLASRGVTGPKYVIEGSCGLAQALDQSVNIDWERTKLDCFDRLSLKSYNSAVPTESAIFCILELHKIHPFDPAEVVSIEADVVQDTYDFTGGGRFGPKTDVHTKEDADHSLPYLLAVALLDGDVQTAQLNPERIAKPDVQRLLFKVRVRPDKSFTAHFPAEFPSRVTVRLKSGQSFSHEVSDYPGFPTRPFTWDQITAKFDELAAGHVGAQLGGTSKTPCIRSKMSKSAI